MKAYFSKANTQTFVVITVFALITFLGVQGNNNVQSLIFQLKRNDPNDVRLDLTWLKGLALNEKTQIMEALNLNSFIGHVTWSKYFQDVAFKNQFEKKLIENNFKYRRYPSHLTHALLSQHAYEVNIHKLNELVLLSNQETWKIEEIFDELDSTGFYSVLYVNERARQMVLAFKNTELAENMLTNQVEVNLEHHFTQCHKATEIAVATARELGYELSMTGHLLGAYLAELSLYYSQRNFFFNARAVTFDSPGIEDFLSKKADNQPSSQANSSQIINEFRLDIITYLSDPNVINTCHGHVGRIVHIPSPKFKPFKKISKINGAKKKITGMIVGEHYETNTAAVGLYLKRDSINGFIQELAEMSEHKNELFVRVSLWPQIPSDSFKIRINDINETNATYKYRYYTDYKANDFQTDLLNDQSDVDKRFWVLSQLDLSPYNQNSLLVQQLRKLKSYFSIRKINNNLTIIADKQETVDDVREILSRLIFVYLKIDDILNVNKYTSAEKSNVMEEESTDEHNYKSSEMVILRNAFGLVHSNRGDYYKALEYYKEALDSSFKTPPYNSGKPETFQALKNVATVYKNLGDHDEELNYLQTSLELKQENLEPNHPYIADSLIDIGLFYFSQEDYENALDYFLNSLEIRQKTLPEHSPDIAQSLTYIGNVYLKQEQIDKAMEYFKRSQHIYQQLLLYADYSNMKFFNSQIELLAKFNTEPKQQEPTLII